jgi:homoserine kinase
MQPSYKCGGPWLICHHNALGNVTAECQTGAPLGDGLGTHDAGELAAIVAAMKFAEKELEE